jgi:quinol monooxygenase YgiN
MHHFAGVIVAASLLALSTTAPAQAQASSGAYYIVTYFETAPAAREQAAALIKQLAEASRKDDGNLRFEALQRIGEPGHFAILEAWKDKAAADAHAGAAHTKHARDGLQPLLTAPYDERVQSGLAVGAPQVDAGNRAIFVVTHADFIPPRKDDGIAATTGIVESSRKERGNLRFEVLQQPARGNHLTLVEVWTSARARVAHITSDAIKAYRSKILPMSGALYDERLYRLVDDQPREPRRGR